MQPTHRQPPPATTTPRAGGHLADVLPRLSGPAWIAAIGACMLLVASVIVVAGQWETIGPEARFAGLVGSLLAIYFAAEAGRRRVRNTATALAVLAACLTAPVGIAAAAALEAEWPICITIGGLAALVATELQSRRWRVGPLKAAAVVATGLTATGLAAHQWRAGCAPRRRRCRARARTRGHSPQHRARRRSSHSCRCSSSSVTPASGRARSFASVQPRPPVGGADRLVDRRHGHRRHRTSSILGTARSRRTRHDHLRSGPRPRRCRAADRSLARPPRCRGRDHRNRGARTGPIPVRPVGRHRSHGDVVDPRSDRCRPPPVGVARCSRHRGARRRNTAGLHPSRQCDCRCAAHCCRDGTTAGDVAARTAGAGRDRRSDRDPRRVRSRALDRERPGARDLGADQRAHTVARLDTDHARPYRLGTDRDGRSRTDTDRVLGRRTGDDRDDARGLHELDIAARSRRRGADDRVRLGGAPGRTVAR